jgi:ATP-dependent DNA helicase RecG
MPSPFDNLSRMLTTEKQRGYDNKAVIGGLERLPGTWAVEAVTQVDSVEERLLIEEMAGLLHRYPTLEVAERATLIEEMLAKIVPLAAGARPAQETPAPPPQPAVQAAPGPDRPAAPVAPPPPPPQRTRGRENVISYLDAPVTRLPGIKRGFSERLSRLNIEKIGDFLTLYPRRYLDYRTLKTINQLEFGEDVTILGTVWDCHAREIRKNLTVINCTLSDQTATIQATWFNQPWLTSRLKPGSHVVISGKVDEYLGRLVFQSPEWEPVDKKQIHTGRLVPIYPLTEGIHQKWLRTIVEQVVD